MNAFVLADLFIALFLSCDWDWPERAESCGMRPEVPVSGAPLPSGTVATQLAPQPVVPPQLSQGSNAFLSGDSQL
eukprot:5165174-Alexandrium_andersonii.AAC.1